MAIRIRKGIVFILVLALCAGQFVMPAMAESGEAAADVNIVIGPNGDSTNVETTVTGTSSFEEHNTETGEITTGTVTELEWSGTNEDGYDVSGSGSQTQYQVHDDYTGRKLADGGSEQGQETEEKIVSTENSSTDENVLVDETDTPISESHSSQPVTETQEGEWVEGSITEEGQWVEGKTQTGDFVENKDEATESETVSSTDINEPENVKLDLTPGKTKTVKKSYTVKQVVEDIIDMPQFGTSTNPITDESGNVIGEEQVVISAKKNAKGDVIGYEKTTTTTHFGKEETISQNTVEGDVSPTGSQAVDPGLPSDYVEGSVELTDESGNVIGSKETVISPKTDENGNVIGYTVTITTTKKNTELKSSTSDKATSSEDAQPVISRELPSPPEAGYTFENGIGTDITVNEIYDEGGQLIGYEVVTLKYDSNGTQIYSGTEQLYGTVSETNVNTQTDYTDILETTETTEVTVETIEIEGRQQTQDVELLTTKLNQYVNEVMVEKEYDFIEIDGKVYFVFTGSMSVAEGKNHGDTSGLNPVTPQNKYVSGASFEQDLYYKGNYNTDTNKNKDIPEDDYRLIGNGMASNLVVGTEKGYTTVHQFKLKNEDGDIFYAYCVDMATGIQPGYFYELVDISDNDYYRKNGGTTDQAVEKIRSIALNGFWGAKSGTGSMSDVQQLVKDYLVNEQGMSKKKAEGIVAELTAGQAVAATQAALWKYGSSSGSSRVDEDDLLKYYYNYGSYNSLKNSSDDYMYTEYIYKALLKAAENPVFADNEGVELLDKEDVKSGSITVIEKVEDNKANNDSNVNNDVYNTDLSFTLGIEPAKIGGDLKVTVKVGDKVVRTARLDVEDSLFSIGIDDDGNGVYTIKNVEIAEGVKININISGTQDVGTGVYIYNSEKLNGVTSQTLVGLAKGERSVDINVNMKFNVTDPSEPQRYSGESSQSGTVTAERTDSKTDVRQDSRLVVSTESSSVTTLSGNVNTKYYADVTVTTTHTDTSTTQRSWESSWEQDVPADPVPYNDDFGFGGNDEKDIEDEDVPLAAVPRTGDNVIIWAVLSIMALLGMAVLRKKEEA